MPDDPEPARFDPAFRAQLTELFRWRRDVRHFRARPVADALVDALLRTAALAPSVGLSQPWRFVTVPIGAHACAPSTSIATAPRSQAKGRSAPRIMRA